MDSPTITLDALLKDLPEMPATPQILPKLQMLLQDDDVTLLDIVSLIKIDPALTAQVIKLSNSGYYGTATPCSNIEEGINRVGFKEVYQLVSILSFKKILDTGIEVYGIRPGNLWQHSISTAVSMESFARFFNDDINTAYTIGMVHGIGKVIINHYLLQKKKTLDTAKVALLLTPEEEIKMLGFTHADAGAALLKNWDFPEKIVHTLKHQLDTLPQTIAPENKYTYILELSKEAGKDLMGEKPRQEIKDPLTQALELPQEAYSKCMQVATKRHQDIQALLQSF